MSNDYQSTLDLDYTPSEYQTAIFDFVVNGRGHGVVNAVAGAGKTTTIVSAARLISGDGLFVAFNKSIASMLSEKLSGTAMVAATVHSHGFAAIRYALRGKRVKVDASKYKNIVKGFVREYCQYDSINGSVVSPDERDAIDSEGFPRTPVLRLLDLARLSVLDCESETFASDLHDIADHHAVDFDRDLGGLIVSMVRRCMIVGKAQTSTVDFTDMVWLPVVNNYRPRQFAWVFVDECQDISRAHRELIKRSARRGGRMLFVGDPKQAIYGFAGADAAAFDDTIRELNATVLPLSVCYRCPSNVLDLAREFCPQIEARTDAPKGVTRSVKPELFVSEAVEGDMVLCRVNAPLVSLCFALITEGISAAVRGRDIGAGLCKIVDEVFKLADDLGTGLEQWAEDQRAFVNKRFSDDDAAALRFELINDQCECIRIIYAKSGAPDTDGLKRAITDLFGDGTPSVVLSSVHRAKGLEASRVFIAEPARLRNPWGKREWMVEQERNLAYVAYTRAMSELVFIE